MNYVFHLSLMLEIYVLLAISANQVVGYSGLLSLGQAIFYGLGAYATAIAITKLGLTYWAGLTIAVLICLTAALIVFYISAKVRDLYFSLGTLSLQIIFFSVIYNWSTITSGPYGISGIDPPTVFGYSISTPLAFTIFGGSCLTLVLLFYRCFITTPIFRLILASRDDHIALLNLGKNPDYYKFISIAISAMISAFAGSLYAAYATFIDPSSFTLDESILILSIVLVGGVGTIRGVFAGASIYVLLPELLKLLHLPDVVAANTRMILFGLLLILVVRLRPEGLFGKRVLQ